MRLDLPLRQTSVLRFGEETLEPRVGSESVAANVKAVTRPDRAVLGSYFQVFPVAMSEGPHPIPSRTRKLSPPEPMVLHAKVCGRVGRCRVNSRTPHLVFLRWGVFYFRLVARGNGRSGHRAGLQHVTRPTDSEFVPRRRPGPTSSRPRYHASAFAPLGQKPGRVFGGRSGILLRRLIEH